ncbi:hypothetical protein O7627_01530 [Solwaraspora sp. WMMD1047]|uniref:hypothetical protein n=1 Tax=Solwaraspora sp. WMMD1047 TaxID=3016102 RepID=UPI002417FF98|nr:hypothetical protein [Solwaraspora sp. WMMD1047]MDG4827982.1 hypothetical protein [Solwaraspora sp. WMMD1047]
MSGADRAGGRDESEWRGEELRAAAEADPETAELIAHIREVAGQNPADVRQVVAEVLAALDRVTGGALGDQLAAGRSAGGAGAGLAGDPGAAAADGDLPPPAP